MERVRLKKTKELLMENSAVRVEDLAAKFEVSPMTIRRDLSKLAAADPNIRRCRGGAMLVTDITSEATFPDKSIVSITEKKALAQRAFPLIQAGQIIYLDAGTTCYELAKLLAEHPMDVEVVTNDLQTAALLGEKHYSVLLTGGALEPGTSCLLGSFAEAALRMLHLDLAFLGATSIDDAFQVSTPTQAKAFMKRLVLAQSAQAFLLADTTKFHHRSRYPIYDLEDLDGVFTDMAFSAEDLELIEKRHINIMDT